MTGVHLFRARNVMYFTQDEEDLADLLIKTGLKRNVARVLVYLAHNPEATSREIERGTDLRQPEVSPRHGGHDRPELGGEP